MAVISTGTAGSLRDHLPTRRIPTVPRQAVVASAAILSSKEFTRDSRKQPRRNVDHQAWMQEAWRQFDICGELRYIARYEANAISSAKIIAAKLPDEPNRAPQPLSPPDDDKSPARYTDEEQAASAVRQFLGGEVSQSQDLARIDTHLMVAGVSYIVAFDEAGERRWHVLSNDEVTDQGNGRYKIRINGVDHVRSAADTLVIRIWLPHPRNRWEPDSPVRGILPVLSELEALTKHVSATVDSRLAGAGLLILPQSMTFPSNRDDLADDEDPFVYELIETMTTPIANRETAAAVVPMVIKVPDDLVGKIQHLSFSSPLDPATHDLRNEAIRRLALGLDTPPEILLGMGDANHWSAWQIEESSIKLHVEPKLRTICHAITVGYLQPYLRSIKVPNWDRYVCWYDTTEIRLRPNRATDARDLHADLLITDEARRRSAGFSEDDAPTDEQFREQLLRLIVSSQPQAAMTLLPLLGIEVPQIPGVTDPTPSIGGAPGAHSPTVDQLLTQDTGVEGISNTAPSKQSSDGDTRTPDTSPTNGATRPAPNGQRKQTAGERS